MLIPAPFTNPLPDQAIASMAASYYIPGKDLKIIGEVFAAKPDQSVAYVDSGNISSEFILGGKYDVNSAAAVQIGGGTRLGEGLFTPDWRVYAGINIALDLGRKIAATSKPEVVHWNTYKGYQPADIEALKNKPFDEIAKLHEFQLRKTVPDADFVGEKPPFEIIRLDGFDFDFGKADIRPEYYEMLNKLAAYLATQPKVLKIRIEGHTDSLGALDRNRRLGQLRADSVRDYLSHSEMIKSLIMEPVGYGADRPISDNSNFQGRKANRRVEIRILRRIPAAPETLQRVIPKGN